MTWEGEPGEPGQPGQPGQQGGAGGKGGDAPSEIGPISDQLAFVRAEEARTHRQRRLTNWLVTMFCLATLITVLVISLQIRHNNDRMVRDDRTIIQNQGLILGSILGDTNADGRTIADLAKLCTALHVQCR